MHIAAAAAGCFLTQTNRDDQLGVLAGNSSGCSVDESLSATGAPQYSRRNTQKTAIGTYPVASSVTGLRAALPGSLLWWILLPTTSWWALSIGARILLTRGSFACRGVFGIWVGADGKSDQSG